MPIAPRAMRVIGSRIPQSAQTPISWLGTVACAPESHSPMLVSHIVSGGLLKK